jgi:phosphoglycolate phosphatase-like HAD superfamily hydrolase
MTATRQRIALLFDIDGTLLESESVDSRYFVRAVREILGDIEIARDWSGYTKVTDIGIVGEILERNGRTVTPGIITAIRERFRELLNAYFDRGETCRPLPGAIEFIKRVRSAGFPVGIATGGWGTTARMKLDNAGIPVSDVPLSSSDDADARDTIMLHCLAKMGGPFDSIVYFGDGIWDRDASARLGWKFVGIGKKLHGKCEVWFEDFGDGDAIFQAVLPLFRE